MISVVGGIGLAIFIDSRISAAALPLLLATATIYFAHKVSLITSNILINENSFQLNNENILFENIAGYFVEESFTMTAIELKLKSNALLSITGITVGKQGKHFKEFISELTRALKANNSSVEELTFSDAHPRLAMGRKTFFYFIVPLMLLMDILVFYLFIAKQFLPWQIFFMNTMVLGMIPYLKKKKK